MNKYFLLLLTFFCQIVCFSQSIKGFYIPDSLKKRNNEYLQKSYDKIYRIDNDKAELYANTILLTGKKEKNSEAIYDGYYKLAHTKGLKFENGKPYADTLLSLTKHLDTKEYPAKAFIIEGILYSYSFNYKAALNEYVKALNLAKNKNEDQYYYIKKLIGILKTTTGEDEESLSLFLEYYSYQKKKIKTDTKDIKNYISAIFSVANAYNKIEQYEKCKFYNKLGIAECRKYNDYNSYPYLVMSESIADYNLKNYNDAFVNLSSIEKDLTKNKDYANLSILYYYKGKINYDLHKESKAIPFLIKSDSLAKLSQGALYTIRDGYEILIDYYKKKDDKENQLNYVNKLMYADSIINNNQNYLSKEIYKKYDTVVLLDEKEKLISSLNNRNSLLFWILGAGFLIISVLLYVYVENKKRIKEYQKQADRLLERSKESFSDFTAVPLPIETKLGLPEKEERSKILLSDEKLQDIRAKLENFEGEKGFLRKNITVDSLAKELGTNRDYLSKSVNELKEKNFSQYINELRINYVVEELNKNEKLRKYTISAIADEVGYNNSESFSNAFRKVTGTLPSYYIKLLEK
ncbi:hypothetical protein IW15_14910 [Chryseobacterium soli]|uniref:HTH araC/xylS-type domain-containing protein n=1 Tax=Chryseobacterium soli TaxID=445961 RepID=A0A086A491_9FLAO|nr:helix-turn-helix transcriptional regulator [Chryseobacterium soli]KFF11505.1 hypothetical protein IW15_14910 [Chryseobacterium soli]